MLHPPTSCYLFESCLCLPPLITSLYHLNTSQVTITQLLMLSLGFRCRGSVKSCKTQTNNRPRYPKLFGSSARTHTSFTSPTRETIQVPHVKIHRYIHNKELQLSGALVPQILPTPQPTISPTIRANPYPLCYPHFLIQFPRECQTPLGCH